MSIEAVQHQGFDPSKFIKDLWTKFNDSKTVKGLEVELRGNGGKKTVLVSDNPKHIQFLKVVKLAVTVYCHRGTNLESIRNKSSESAGHVLDFLARTLDLKEVRAINGDTVTLRRIASCFPFIVLLCYENGIGKQLFNIKELGFESNDKLGVYFGCPLICSMFPIELYNKNIDLVMFMLLVSIKCDLVINKKAKTTPLKKLFSHMKTEIKWKLYDSKIRASMLKWHGILDDSDEIVDGLKTIMAGAEAKILKIMPDAQEFLASIKVPLF